MAAEDEAESNKTNKEWEYSGPETLTIVCSRPVKMNPVDPSPLQEFTVSEPTIEQMMAYTEEERKSRNEFSAGAVLIAKNAGISIGQAKKLSTRDFEKALTFMMGFTTPPQPDGAG